MRRGFKVRKRKTNWNVIRFDWEYDDYLLNALGVAIVQKFLLLLTIFCLLFTFHYEEFSVKSQVYFWSLEKENKNRA